MIKLDFVLILSVSCYINKWAREPLLLFESILINYFQKQGVIVLKDNETMRRLYGYWMCDRHTDMSAWFNIDKKRSSIPTGYMILNTQVPRHLLFCEGGIFSAHTLTLVGTKLTPYIWIALKFISFTLQVKNT